MDETQIGEARRVCLELWLESIGAKRVKGQDPEKLLARAQKAFDDGRGAPPIFGKQWLLDGRTGERFDQPIETTIEDPGTFYPAEDYHQNYYQKNKVRYTFYKNSCGRPDRLKEIWGDEAMPHDVPASSAAS